MPPGSLTLHQRQYWAWLLQRKAASGSVESLASTQKRQRELEGKRSQWRRELFMQQDEIEARRNTVIEELERQLGQKVDEKQLFTIESGLA